MLSDYGYLAGGAEVFMQNLTESLRQQGHQVLILASNAGRGQPGGKPDFADEWCYGTTGPGRAIVQSANPLASRRLRKVLREFKPDLVHIHIFLTQLSPLILKELVNVPVVYSAHWYRSVCLTGFKMLPGGGACQQAAGVACLRNRCVPLWDWLPLMMQLKTLQRRKETISAVVATSDTIRSRLERDGLNVDRIIQLGVKEIQGFPNLSSQPRIGFAARLVEEKGGAVLLQAFQQICEEIPTAVLDVFGDGPQLSALKHQAAKLGIEDKVCFHGYLEQDELQTRLATAWVQAAPTLFEEPGGVVGYEAAMRGTALVASNYGGFIDTVIVGKTGYLTPPGEAGELARALISILSDRQRAEAFGRASREQAKKLFGFERVTRQHLDLYRELIFANEAGIKHSDGDHID
jgi:glycosyltransferase involved in cell wall biosynthesis